MKTISKITTSLSVVAVLLFTALLLPLTTVSAHGDDHDNSVVTQAQASDNNDDKEDRASSYEYTAQKGDSYTLMARKAVQTYGITSNVNLSEGQIIFAETNLTKEAGSPRLAIDQKVEINQDTVKSWVDKAGQLNDTQKAAWSKYAQSANFNTNAVGQAR